MHPSCSYRCWAIIFQTTICICNAFAWMISIIAVIWGLIIGIGNGTVRPSHPTDLGISTPATIMIIYGFGLIGVTTFGCFSSITANTITSILYLLCIIGFITFDVIGGYTFLFRRDSFTKYHESLQISLDYYGESEAKYSIGIFPTKSKVLWEHLQALGRCCGIRNYNDWKRSKFGIENHSVPDSCCSKEYQYRYCGSQVFRLSDNAINDMLYKDGCIAIFPESLRTPPDYRVGVVGPIIASILLTSLILTFVIMLMVFRKKFAPEQGLNNLDYISVQKKPTATDKEMRNNQAQNDKKVHPEPEDNKKVEFRAAGPFIIENIPKNDLNEPPGRKTSEVDQDKLLSDWAKDLAPPQDF